MSSDNADADIHLRPPRLEDGKAVHELIRDNPPLDLNSVYSYFLLCSHFAGTCAVAEVDGRVTGFLSAYREPESPDRLFVWQVVVDPSMRGHGLAGRLLQAVLERDALGDVRFLEATVNPSNTASARFLEKTAERLGADLEKSVFLSREDFGGEEHEEEILFRIGPLS